MRVVEGDLKDLTLNLMLTCGAAQVRVVEGDLKELLGRVRSVLEDGRVEVMPSMKDLDEVLTFEPGQLAKYFQARRPLHFFGRPAAPRFLELAPELPGAPLAPLFL